MSTGQITLIALTALLMFWGVGAYNRLVSLRAAMAAAWSPIDALLRRRQALAFDLASLLAEQPAMGDEVGRAALQTVMAATRQAQAACDHAQVRPSSAGAVQSLGLAEQVLDGAIRPLRVLVESRLVRVGEAEVVERLRALLQGLSDADVQIDFNRRLFKEAVGRFNAAVHELPTRLIASAFGFRPAAALQGASPERGPDSQLVSSFEERG